MSIHNDVFEVQINGTPFRVVQELYSRRFLDVVRSQADNGQEPSEFSLNPNDLWRRSQTDWQFGAGQTVFDSRDSLRRRFRESTNLNPFLEEGSIQLTRKGTVVWTDADAALSQTKMIVNSQGTYVLFDPALTQSGLYRLGVGMVPNQPAGDVLDAVGVGDKVYASVTGLGVYQVTDSTAWALVNTLVPEKLAYVRGRLMAVVGSDLYNITDLSSTTPPSSLTSGFIDQSMEWTAFGETQSFILVAGMSGVTSLVYRITIREDGTALTAPVACAELPTGERIRAIQSYLGLVVLATSKGVRVGRMNGGELQYGPLVHECSCVWDLEPQGKFVYFSRESGLGRLDLSRFLPDFELVPVYALDIETGNAAQNIRSIVTRPAATTIGNGTEGDLLFLEEKDAGVDDGGVWEIDSSTFTTSQGVLCTGRITYGMADQKSFMFLEIVGSLPHADDSIQVVVIDELDAAEHLVGQLDAQGHRGSFTVNLTGEWVELKVYLNNGNPTGATSPSLERWTLRAMPIPSRTKQIEVPIDLRRTVLANNGMVSYQDQMALFQTLERYVETGESIEYTEFGETFIATVENVQLGPDLDVDVDFDWWEGTALLTLRVYGLYVPTLDPVAPSTTTDVFGRRVFGRGLLGDINAAGS